MMVGAASLMAVGRLLRQDFGLEGKVVLLTGGSRGLGLVLARELVGRGARLALCGRDAELLERARAELAGEGLPRPGGIGRRAARGAESESAISRSWLTSLTRAAELRNHEG